MSEEQLRLLVRIKNSGDGKDFVEFLLQLSKENYDVWKLEGGDLLRGRALALDYLIELFETCHEKLVVHTAVSPTEWA